MGAVFLYGWAGGDRRGGIVRVRDKRLGVYVKDAAYPIGVYTWDVLVDDFAVSIV